jgi:uncharacterized Zn-finger protein
MKKINVVLAISALLAALLLFVIMTKPVIPAKAPGDLFFPLIFRSYPRPDQQHLTFWSGDLRLFALQNNTRVEIFDLDTGSHLDFADPRVESVNFDTNPFVLERAGDSFEGIGGQGQPDNKLRIKILASDAATPSISRPIAVWTGSLDDSLRHPPSPPGPTSTRVNAWMSYIHAIPEGSGPTTRDSSKLGREFLGFTSREMFLFAQKSSDPTEIVIEDLMTNTDHDSDDNFALGPGHPSLRYADQDVEIYYLDQFEDDTVKITSNVELSVLVGFGSMERRDWTATPPSYAVRDGGSERGTLFYTYASAYLTVFPLEDDTILNITDLSDGDDSRSVTLSDGDLDGDYEVYTPVLDSRQNGEIKPRASAPAVNIVTNAENPFDNDFVKVESDKPVLVYVGPVASDYEEFADMAFAVPREGGGRIVYAYAQNFGDREGASNDLQIFSLDASTVVTITSLSRTTGFRNDGPAHNGGWHDFVIGPGIGACPPQDGRTYVPVQPWCYGTKGSGVWWGAGVWDGEMVRIESTDDIVVINGDFDKIHFGTYTPFVVTPRDAPEPALVIVDKQVSGVDDDTTLFDFTMKGGSFGVNVDEAFTLTHGLAFTQPVFAPGSYTVAEDVPSGWTLSDITCEGGLVSIKTPQVVIDALPGDTIRCTFTNTPAPSITVVKRVAGVTDDTPFDFTFDDVAFSLKDGDSKVFASLDPGTYTVTESVPDGWALTDIQCEGGAVAVDEAQVVVDLGADDNVVCTFTNAQTPSVTVKKQVSGSADDTVFDFTLNSEAFTLADGESYVRSGLEPGVYDVTETVPQGWELIDITCAGGSVSVDMPNATIDLGANDDVVCTFTNRPAPELPAITIIKEVPDVDDSVTPFDFAFNGEAFSLKDGESTTYDSLQPGSYTVSETAPVGWALVDVTCEGGSVTVDIPQVMIELAAEDDVVCVFTNRPATASVEIRKQVTGVDDDVTSFAFTFDGQGFNLTHAESTRFENLEPGSYTVAEIVPENWALTRIECEGGSVNVDAPQVSVDLAAGDHVVCTFTNTPTGSIEIIKLVKGTADSAMPFAFAFDGHTFSLKHGESALFEDLLPGVYTIVETVPPGWGLGKIVCDNGIVLDAPNPPEVAVDLGAGERVICTFENWPISAVELLSFTAEGGASSVVLRWETASELEAEGFNVWRARTAGGPYIQLNPSLIPARGNADKGANYSFTDIAVMPGVTYYYKLEDVDLTGAGAFHGPVEATPY